MGQKINPISLRIGITKPWTSRWFFAAKAHARYPYAKFLEEDEAIRNVIRMKIAQAGVAGIDVERTSANLRITIKAAKPGFVIGQRGKGIEDLTKAIEKRLAAIAGPRASKRHVNLSVNVEELKRTEVSAAYLAQQIAWDLEKRMPFRRTVRRYLEQTMQNRDVKGAKIAVGGRLDGADIARREVMKAGTLPLNTLRTDIDYGTATAVTAFSAIGIKVWIYKGEVFAGSAEENRREADREEQQRLSRRPASNRR